MGKGNVPDKANGSDDDSVKAIRAELAKEHRIDPPPDPKEGK